MNRDFIETIKLSIDKALENGANPIAAFDADGTLWRTDMGEMFLDFKIKKQLLPEAMKKHTLDELLEMRANATQEYLELLTHTLRGQKVSTIESWAKDCFQEMKNVPVIEAQKEIIQHLQNRNVEVYIVTASLAWAVVEPAAKLFNIPKENVIGMRVCVDENDVAQEGIAGVMPWKEGKPKELLRRTNNKRPFFCSGNSIADYPLLELSTDLRLAVSYAEKGTALEKEEQELATQAKKHQWFQHINS